MTTYQESKVKQISKEWIPADSRGHHVEFNHATNVGR